MLRMMLRARLVYTCGEFYDITYFFFFNDTATTEIYTLSLHDALPIYVLVGVLAARAGRQPAALAHLLQPPAALDHDRALGRSEEHTSELQSRQYLVCRLLLEKKKQHAYKS